MAERASRLASVPRVIGAALAIQVAILRHNAGDATAGAVSVAVSAALNLVVLSAAVTVRGDDPLWQSGGAFVLVGLVRIAWGLVETVTEGLWTVGEKARTGELMLTLSRPTPVVLQIMLERVHFERALDILFGAALLVHGLDRSAFAVSPASLAGMVGAIGLAAAVYLSVILAGAAVAIRASNSGGTVMTTAGQVASLSLYPASTFLPVLGPTLLGLLPVFAVTALPGHVLFGETAIYADPLAATVGFGVAVAGVAAAIRLWTRALATYEGTGS